MIGLVLLFPKHPLDLKFLIFSPEKFALKLGNLKWGNGDFVESSTEFTTSVTSALKKLKMKLLKVSLSN